MTGQAQTNLSASDKFEAIFAKWMSPPGVQFATPEAEKAYRQRTQMIKDAVQLKKPARVPVCPNIGFYPFTYAGVTSKDAMYDYAKLGMALKKFHADFQPDSLSGSPIYGSGKVLELLDYKVYRWPGHGVPENTSYQCVEAEYMKAGDYDHLINDPSDYFMRSYLPRVFGALDAWKYLAPATDLLELPFVASYVIPIGIPEVQEAFKKLLEAGRLAMEWIQACGAIDNATISTHGIPACIGGFTKAPFDNVGDTLRGTGPVMLDKFRNKEKLLTAVERWIPAAIAMGVNSSRSANNPIAFIPLHKGADGFMSNPDFKKYYWPSLKAVILGLVNEGVVPWLFVEGAYNQRLDIICDPDIPKGTTVWMFDRTDLKEVKKRFAGWACFGGNVPVSMFTTSSAQQIKSHVKRLLDDVAQDGGFILSTGAVVDDSKPENLHAFIEAGREYGVYR